jgi:hypothetical protein
VKLEYVTKHYQKDEWARYALWVLSSMYGLDELLVATFGDLK